MLYKYQSGCRVWSIRQLLASGQGNGRRQIVDIRGWRVVDGWIKRHDGNGAYHCRWQGIEGLYTDVGHVVWLAAGGVRGFGLDCGRGSVMWGGGVEVWGCECVHHRAAHPAVHWMSAVSHCRQRAGTWLGIFSLTSSTQGAFIWYTIISMTTHSNIVFTLHQQLRMRQNSNF